MTKYLNKYSEFQNNIDDCEYIPEEGDKEAAIQAVNRLLENESAWKEYFDTCIEYIKGFLTTQSTFTPLSYASSRSSDPRQRNYNEPFIILFDSTDADPNCKWHADLNIPSNPMISDIQINISFPNLPKEFQTPQKLYLHGQELSILNGTTSISHEIFLESLKSGAGEIYVIFNLPKQYMNNPEQTEKKSFGKIRISDYCETSL